ncbi:MAG: GNAT family N-acetyltransferase [Anaerolineae bacterium]|nr:GNAT family N-acetyltransferase [Anaerolineae bacterium]
MRKTRELKELGEMGEIVIRPAVEADIEAILTIVNGYAAQNLMLPRTAEQIRRVLQWFLVAEQDGRIVGCGSNVELTPKLTELRSLAVVPELRGNGLGQRLVAALVEKARADGYDQICALTLNEGFFNRCGFVTVDRWAISPKIWHECIYCPKFDACDEIAVLMNLTEPALAPKPISPEVSLELWQGLRLALAS